MQAFPQGHPFVHRGPLPHDDGEGAGDATNSEADDDVGREVFHALDGCDGAADVPPWHAMSDGGLPGSPIETTVPPLATQSRANRSAAVIGAFECFDRERALGGASAMAASGGAATAADVGSGAAAADGGGFLCASPRDSAGHSHPATPTNHTANTSRRVPTQ
jgi:hypothetical protein